MVFVFFQNVSVALQEFESIRPEFVPYLLNFLRDQTIHLIQGCRSASQSPAKTPTSFKKIKPTTCDAQANKTSTPLPSAPVKSNRVKLFSSPFDLPVVVRSKCKPSPNASTSVNLKFDSFTSDASDNSTAGLQSFKREQTDSRWSTGFDNSYSFNDGQPSGNSALNTSSPGIENLPASKYDSTFNKSGSFSHTPELFKASSYGESQHGSKHNKSRHSTSETTRSKQKHSLGEFFRTPEYEVRKKKSPHSGHREDPSHPSSIMGRRGKGRRSADKRIQPIRLLDESASPVFSINNLEDFPPMAAHNER